MMRELAFGLIIFESLLSTSLGGEFPSEATIVADDAPLRSGPSDSFYATDYLAKGTTVEVYLQEGDWLAIRPPAGSFSWVLAGDVNATNQPDVVRVIRSGTRTRVGSRVSNDRNVQYVRLHAGEALRLVDGEMSSGSEWLKIEPPSGEFRWIHRRFVSATSPPLADQFPEKGTAKFTHASFESSSPKTAKLLSSTSDDGQAASTPIAAAVVPDAAPGMTSMKTEPIPIETPAPAPELQPAEQLPASQSAWVSRTEDEATVADRIEQKDESQPNAITDFDSEIRSLDLELSRQVTRDSSDWNLATLRKRTEQVIDTAHSSRQRSRARELLKRIAEFEQVQRQSGGLAGHSATPPAASHPNRPEVVGTPQQLQGEPVRQRGSALHSIVSSRSEFPAAESETDGYGWLIPVATNRADLPRFALTNDEGVIMQFVSPRAGLNLRPHLRQKVRILGERSFLPSLGKPHVSAARIVAAGDRRRSGLGTAYVVHHDTAISEGNRRRPCDLLGFEGRPGHGPIDR
jgi:SH3-like domain-containing protein